ncbi:hypothetical protein AC478_01895 [miscellaneous Crenarchaeota group-1 archaeon SG8-32-3]|uniref:UPF0201 protein AC478_01895 n=1 Tax=miscellaneous Crenarchaeota group-1 archaeon SG8-32-3 TaxID=1685125 RepID=A0A0M0BTU9_9ARCH|nr:MAG: hypothetical protein AC478_01895 [miscellaneous Crenarchaeota group-1 archaeon SG8-32-3]
MEEITVTVETEINPTEDEGKVEKAVANIFGNTSAEIETSYKGGILYAQAEGQEALIKFRNLLSLDRIRAAARKVFLGGKRENTISFCVNKQVAFAGHISFSEEMSESPLGPIKVTIACEDPRRLIDWLTARTT